jgi:hypothetical protein
MWKSTERGKGLVSTLPSARLRAFSGLAKVAMVSRDRRKITQRLLYDLQRHKTAAYKAQMEAENKGRRKASAECDRQTHTERAAAMEATTLKQTPSERQTLILSN